MRTASPIETAPSTIDTSDRMLVLTAHPDDRSVFHAGLIRQAVTTGATVYSAVATAGEESSLNARHLWQAEYVKNGQRVREDMRSARLEGIDLHNTRYNYIPDGRVYSNLRRAVEWVGGIALANQITVIVTAGPDGYDAHPDHIAMDMAGAIVTVGLRRLGVPVRLLRLDAANTGSIIIPVDTNRKIHDTMQNFSQFPGISFWGRSYVPQSTRTYLERYQSLVYGRNGLPPQETYNVFTVQSPEKT